MLKEDQIKQKMSF